MYELDDYKTPSDELVAAPAGHHRRGLRPYWRKQERLRNGAINDTPDATIDIYERLAHALDALPHGFARTPSGVELKLIKMAFTPEEVWLAGQLTRIPETAAEIAKRVGRDVVEVTADAREPDPADAWFAWIRPGCRRPAWHRRSRARRSTGWALSWSAGTRR